MLALALAFFPDVLRRSDEGDMTLELGLERWLLALVLSLSLSLSRLEVDECLEREDRAVDVRRDWAGEGGAGRVDVRESR